MALNPLQPLPPILKSDDAALLNHERRRPMSSTSVRSDQSLLSGESLMSGESLISGEPLISEYIVDSKLTNSPYRNKKFITNKPFFLSYFSQDKLVLTSEMLINELH